MIVHEKDVSIGTERFKDGTGIIYMRIGDTKIELDPKSVAGIAGSLVAALMWFTTNKFND